MAACWTRKTLKTTVWKNGKRVPLPCNATTSGVKGSNIRKMTQKLERTIELAGDGENTTILTVTHLNDYIYLKV